MSSTSLLSPAQQQLLAGQLLAVDVPVCNMAMACTVEGVIDPMTLQRAWDDVLSTTDALRIRIVVADDRITQSTGHAWPTLDRMDYATYPDAASRASAWMEQDAATAIAPDGVLGRAAVIKLADDQWVVYWNLHHAICDATSFAVLWRRLSRAYADVLDQTGQPSTRSRVLEAARVQEIGERHVDNPAGEFLEFVDATHEAMREASKRKPGYLEKIEMVAPPTLFGRRAGRVDTASTRVPQTFSSARLEALARLASLPQARGFGKGIGHCNVLLTTLAVLLYRLGVGSTQTLGLPLPQRQESRFGNTIGLFVEVLPLQISIDEQATFGHVLKDVRAEFMGLLKEGAAGDSAQLDANAVPAILNYINAPLGDFGALPAHVAWLHPGHIDSQHLIRLQVEDWQGSGEPSLAFDFNDAIFDQARREQTLQAFWALFDAMSVALDQSIDAVAIAEPRVLTDTDTGTDTGNDAIADVSAFSNTGGPAQAIRTLPARVRQQWLDMGEQPALVQGDLRISARELLRRSGVIQARLQASGVRKGARVAVYLHRDHQLPLMLLSVQLCGAAYIPIDANQPAARVRDILADASPQLIVTSRELYTELAVADMLLVEDIQVAVTDDVVKTDAVQLPDDLSSLGDTAYIMYTSGSTGTPKGVSIGHAALANYGHWAATFYAGDAPVDMALFTPIGFDLTVTSLFLPWMTGGTLNVFDEREYLPVAALGAVIEQDAVDIIKLTPAHLSLLNGELCSANKRQTQFIVGGEDLPAPLALHIHRLFDGRVKIHNEYGPTEATVGCVLHTFDPAVDREGSVPIGQPVAGARVRVLNAAGQQQLTGCSGELYVAGASLGNGYWQRSALTEAAFVPLSPVGERFYRTGDRVRERSDGKLVYLGRSNEQFKLRGHRIEPAEIESAALQFPGVNACVAVLTHPQRARETRDEKCQRCGLSSQVPGALLDADGCCQPCRNFAAYRARVESYFRPMQEFRERVAGVQPSRRSDLDCIMLLSGGKDSTYALAQLVDMGLRVLAFTLDNGFISESAKANAARVCDALGVEHRTGSTPAMNAIFLDSLQRHANVCNGCFKTIYTLALQLANELDINCIVTGLSRGQFFETRLSEDWFMAPDYQADAMDDAIVAARKAYHRRSDVVSCSLDTAFLDDDRVFERIQILDFYRYCDVDLDEMYRYLDQRLPWVRPADTGRSTNCLINDAGIYVHRHERGYHNYAQPYSWDVRLGHKERDAALEELNDEIDEAQVLKQLETIGYQLTEKQSAQIAVYYSADTDVSEGALRREMTSRLPQWMMPTWLIELPSLPLSANGKVDRRRLPVPRSASSAVAVTGVPRAFAESSESHSARPEQLPPNTEAEKLFARIWSRHLRVESIGINNNFFALGGDSLMAIRIIAEVNQAGYPYKPADIFEFQTIAQLARLALSSRRPRSLQELDGVKQEKAEKPAAFAALSGGQLDALSKALGKRLP